MSYADTGFFKGVVAAGIIIITLSIPLGSALLFLIGVMLLLFYGISTFYEKHVTDQLSLTNDRVKLKMFPGDKEVIHFELDQHGRLPILNGKLSIKLDTLIDPDVKVKLEQKATVTVDLPLHLYGKEKVEYTLPFQAKARGVVKVRGLQVHVPNALSFGGVQATYDPLYRTEIIVYPTPLPVAGIEQMNPKNRGGRQAKWSLHENQMVTIGTRGYVAGDPFNRIHWKASAKNQELQTRIIEKSADLSWMFIVNVRHEHDGRTMGITPELEQALSHITYMCRYAAENGIPYEIIMNVRAHGPFPFLHLPIGEGKEQLAKALELLARVDRNSLTTSFDSMLMFLRKHESAPVHLIQLGHFTGEHAGILRGWIKGGSHFYHVVTDEEQAYLTEGMKGFEGDGYVY